MRYPSTRTGIHPETEDGSSPLVDPKHEKFAQLITEGFPIGKAYQGCGYPNAHAPNGYRLMNKPKVRSRIAFLQQKKADEMIQASARVMERDVEKQQLTKAWVVDRLMTITQRCMQAEPVRDAAGKEMGIYQFNATGANRALELLGKEAGMFVDRSKVELDVRNLTAEQLEALMAEMEKTILAGQEGELRQIRESAGLLPAGEVVDVEPEADSTLEAADEPLVGVPLVTPEGDEF